MMLQGYVINLDRHPERLFKFYQQADAHFFQRVPAVDKQVLALLGNGETCFNLSALAKKIQRPVTLGEIGCTLSHIKAWQAIANNENLQDHEFAVVAEDDVKLIANFQSYLTAFIKLITNLPFELVILQKLGLYSGHISLFNGGDLSYSIPSSSRECNDDGSSLYLIRKSKAKSLVAELASRKPDWLADHFSTFCELNHIAILSHQFGYIEDHSQSDLEADRNVARQHSI